MHGQRVIMWNVFCDEPECMCVGVASHECFIATHAALNCMHRPYKYDYGCIMLRVIS